VVHRRVESYELRGAHGTPPEDKLDDEHRKQLGDPDICLGGFELWVNGHQFPDSSEAWDGNRLDVTPRHAWYPSDKGGLA
jgi:hypothetical protein